MMDKNKLLFRRQYILGPRFIESLTSWKKIKVNNSIFLTVHPDLQIEQAIYNDNAIILLGYILDPYDPLSSNSDIVNRLIRQINSADDVFKYIDNMGGRFVIIINFDNNLRLFSDATGMRQVFYTKDFAKGMWCASQPGIIAEQLNLVFDKEVLNDLINSPFFKNNPEYWYPGDSSPFQEIIHLLPNHYLDLDTGESDRYWPTNRLNTISVEECLEKSSELLKGLIESAYHRFNLGLAITAGVDSRVLLAASREFSKDILYFTQTHQHLTEKGMDIVIPAKLLRKLGLKHKIIKCPSNMDDEFKNIFKRNVTTARVDKGLIIYCSYKCFDQEKVQISGNVSEIARCCYRSPELSKVSEEALAKFAKMEGNTFAIEQFKKWLSTTNGIEEEYNINILDLFHWEQRIGNWAAMTFTESDIANETFLPFNCRCLLTTLLSVEEKYRMKPNFELYKKLIMHMWPESLELPINPPTPLTAKDRVKNIIKKIIIPVYRWLNTC